MTGSSRARQYWDASVIVASIMNEPGRGEICRSILDAAASGEVEIVTSALSLTEVVGGRSAAGRQEVQQAIETFFAERFIHLISADRAVNLRARRLRIDRLVADRRDLPGNDAVHLATALLSNVDVMFSYDDGDLTPLSNLYAATNGRALSISHPVWTSQLKLLPDEPV